jgi:hypothetical protein
MNSHVQLFSRHFVSEPQVDGFFDAYSCSVQYVVSDPSTGRCAAIDLVLDYVEIVATMRAPNISVVKWRWRRSHAWTPSSHCCDLSLCR